MYKKYYRLLSEGNTTQDIADLTGTPYETIRKGLYRYAKKHGLPTASEIEEKMNLNSDEEDRPFIEKTIHHPNGDIEVTKRVPSEVLDKPEDMLVELGLDPEHWESVETSRSKWGLKQGKMQFSVRVRARPKKTSYEQFELLEMIMKNVEHYKPEPVVIPSKKPTRKQSLVVPLYDLHFSMSNKPFFDRFLEGLASRMYATVYEEIVIILGGDSLEHDNFIFTTEAGTRTEETEIRDDYDGLYKFLARLINLAQTNSVKVRYINIRGNHSPSMDWAISHSLSYMFPEVEFDIVPETLKAVTVYDTFFGVLHGHIKSGTRDEQNIGYLFRDDFSKSQFHYILTGHLHSDKEFVKDTGTFMRIQFPSPDLGNQWSKDKLFHAQFRGLRCLVVEPDEGITENFYFRNKG